MTSLSCVIEDGGEQRTGIITKPYNITLADIKAELNITQEGVYLAKTPDGADTYHWSIIVNDQDVVPYSTDGSISIKVRPTFHGYTRLVYQVEGTYEAVPHVRILNKLPTQVLLKDVLALYRGLPGTMFFKEFDPDVGSFHWTVVSHEDELVPSFDGQIICKVRLHPQKKEGQWTVLAFHTEGVIHPSTTRIPKTPSQVTVQDVRQGFFSIHGVMPGEMFVRVGSQYLSLQDPDIANNPLHSTHCLIQIKVRPFAQLPLAPIQHPTSTTESFMPVFDTNLLPSTSNLHSHHASPQHVLHHPSQQIQHTQSTHSHLQQHSQLPPLPQLPHLTQLHQLHHLQLHQLQHPQQSHQIQQLLPQQHLQQHQLQQHQLQHQMQQQQHQLQQHQLQIQQHQLQQHQQLHHQQLLHPQLQLQLGQNTGLTATDQLLSQDSQQIQDGQTSQSSEQEQDSLHHLQHQRSQEQYQEQPSEFSQPQDLLAHQHLEESSQSQEFQPQELTQQQQEELTQQQEELARQSLEPPQELEHTQELEAPQEMQVQEQGSSTPQEHHVDIIHPQAHQENFEHQENF